MKGVLMYSSNQICEKIRSIFPETGKCGDDLKVEYSMLNKSWVVHLKYGGRHLKTYLEPEDANICMDDKQCIGLGLQVYQLKDNITNMGHA